MKINKQSGQASRLLLVLAAVVLVAVIIVYLVMRMAEKPPAPKLDTGPAIVLPVYEQTLGNIRFVFESALDKGSILKASSVVNTQYSSTYQKDFAIDNPGAKFIQVTIGAQNVGTIETDRNAWKVENIVDSQAREFAPLEGYTIDPWLPNPDKCGIILQPAFDPTPCVKIYEVSKASTGLKVRVQTGKDNTAQGLSSGKAQSFLIDLIVK